MIIYRSSKTGFIQDTRSCAIVEKLLANFEASEGRRPSPGEERAWQSSLQYVANVLDDRLLPRMRASLSNTRSRPARSASTCCFRATTKPPAPISSSLSSSNGRRQPPRTKTAFLLRLATARSSCAAPIRATRPGPMRSFCGASMQRAPLRKAYELNHAPIFTIIRRKALKRTCVIRATATIFERRLFSRRAGRTGEAQRVSRALHCQRRRGQNDRARRKRRNPALQGARRFRCRDDPRQPRIRSHRRAKDDLRTRALARARQKPAEPQRAARRHCPRRPWHRKSVVAVNLLAALTAKRALACYVSKNAAPRAVYAAKLTGTLKKTVVSNLFKGPDWACELTPDEYGTFACILVDEAHRLREKSGLFANKGANQIRELIRAGRVTVFFLDDDQRIHIKDIGSVDAVRAAAEAEGASVEEFELPSQFRCGGSDGYLAWLDRVLGIAKQPTGRSKARATISASTTRPARFGKRFSKKTPKAPATKRGFSPAIAGNGSPKNRRTPNIRPTSCSTTGVLPFRGTSTKTAASGSSKTRTLSRRAAFTPRRGSKCRMSASSSVPTSM